MDIAVKRIELRSQHLEESRTLHISCGNSFAGSAHRYVVFCADGQMLSQLTAAIVDDEVASRFLLVGIESNPTTRDYDYVDGYFPDRFAAHERFVIDEVLPAIDYEFGIFDARCTRGVFGCSNGATLAHSLLVRNPEKFAFAILFSAADNRVPLDRYPESHSGRYYLAAGTGEPEYLRATKSIATDLQMVLAPHRYIERDGRHEISFWSEEFPVALHWIAGQ